MLLLLFIPYILIGGGIEYIVAEKIIPDSYAMPSFFGIYIPYSVIVYFLLYGYNAFRIAVPMARGVKPWEEHDEPVSPVSLGMGRVLPAPSPPPSKGA